MDKIEFDLAVNHCPVSYHRLPAAHADEQIHNPGCARANVAVSTTMPLDESEWAKQYRDYTVLQQHVLFWDRDRDGVIYPWDTYIGFRDLGFNLLFCLLAVVVINVNFSYPTRLYHTWVPDPFFRVYIDGIHKAKHGSDSGTYDPEGRFVPQIFENLFSKWDKDGDGALTLYELFQMMRGHRCAADPFGWGAAFFEFGTTWLLVQRGGKVHKEDLRQLYNGSIFYRIREERRSREGWRQGFGLGGDSFIGGIKLGSTGIDNINC